MDVNALEEWLKDRPQVVKDMARKFPPGSFITDHNGVKLWVVAYNEDGGLSVSETNPGEDYKKAVATRKQVCACCIGKL